jgi:hypothetical protein
VAVGKTADPRGTKRMRPRHNARPASWRSSPARGLVASCGPGRISPVRDERGMKKPTVGLALRARQQKIAICSDFTGATDPEPATSDVTGRYGATGYDRLRPGSTSWQAFPRFANRL